MKRVRKAAVVLATAAVFSCKKPAPPPVADAAAPSTDQVLGGVLPGVVLLVNRHDDGQIGFGAGIVLNDEGEVLTNLHVAGGGQLGALTYDPKRVSYIPQDGGLGRYLFENDDQVIHARLMRGDPVLDLALVKLDAPTKRVKLTLRAEPVKQGERVMAVGHPGETVWSFTSGVVSSLHQGMIQTDAAINRGNSGGPLIDGEGRVVGINTSKLVGDMHGIGFARPIDIAKPLIEGHGQAAVLDRSTPERAMKTCWAAVELGSEVYLDCFDWDGLYELTQESLRRRVKLLNLKGAAKADYEHRIGVITKDEMIAAMKAAQLALLHGEDPREAARSLQHRVAEVDMLDGAAEAYRKGFAKAPTAAKLKQRLEAPDGGIAQYERDFDQALFNRTGMKIDTSNPRAMFELIKLGRRIEKTANVDDAHAFVAIRGRNHDGTDYRLSTFLVKQPSGWVIVLYPLPKEEALRPPDFPNLDTSYEEDMTRLVKLEAEMYQPLKPSKKAGR